MCGMKDEELIKNIRYVVNSTIAGWECSNGSPVNHVCYWSGVQCDINQVIAEFGVTNTKKDDNIRNSTIPENICKLLIRLLQDLIYKICVYNL